ncbi:MAG: hypothetical protein SOY06_00415 [Prevotella sp.]|nr:hypothetical protein [Bacteroidales bacterium]MDY4228303.1 hypothetical protein [Prevotella sp.]
MKKTYIQPTLRIKELGTEEMIADSDLNTHEEIGGGQKAPGLRLESEDESSTLPQAPNLWE